jgi:hypothetical protein
MNRWRAGKSGDRWESGQLDRGRLVGLVCGLMVAGWLKGPSHQIKFA